MKQLLILLLISSLSIFTTISCTSSDDAADGEEISGAEGVEDGSELDNIEDAELDGEEVAEGGDEFAEEGGEVAEGAEGEEDASDEDLLMDEGAEGGELAEGEEPAATEEGGEVAGSETPAEDASSSDFSEDASTTPTDETGTISDISGGESTDSTVAETSESLTDDSDAATTPGFSETDSGSSFSAPTEDIARTWVPVKKVASAPFNQGGQLLNTVYIVRPSDSLSSASQKIFGADRNAEILSANPHLNRSFTTGDKLYYNSPNRPTDSTQMLTYYEDVGMPAQTYVTQEGDNIRSLGTTLLGDANSWKELWATNPAIDSKDQLPAGTEIRYFPEGGTPAPPTQTVAENVPPPQPPMDQAMNDIPPPPPTDMAGTGTMEPPPPPPMDPPPPPPPVAMEPPPPPPPPTEAKVAQKDGGLKGMNMKLILAACLLIGGGLAIVILQKSKSKKINIGETQI
jgi:hypothetical protein